MSCDALRNEAQCGYAISLSHADPISNLYRKYSRKILSKLVGQGMSFDLAEDLVQEVFLSVVKYKNKLADIDNMESWLWTVVRNTKCSHFRKKEARIDAMSCNDASAILNIASAEQADESDLLSRVCQAIDEMEKRDPRRAYALRMSVTYECSVEQLRDYLDKRTTHQASVYRKQSFKKLERYMASA